MVALGSRRRRLRAGRVRQQDLPDAAAGRAGAPQRHLQQRLHLRQQLLAQASDLYTTTSHFSTKPVSVSEAASYEDRIELRSIRPVPLLQSAIVLTVLSSR